MTPDWFNIVLGLILAGCGLVVMAEGGLVLGLVGLVVGAALVALGTTSDDYHPRS